MFEVSVTDLGGGSNTATMLILVSGGPSFLVHNFSTPPATVGVAYSGNIATNATDPGLGAGEALSFYKVTGPAWLNVATNGGLSGVPSSANVGENIFLVVVEDPGGLANTGDLNILVNAASTASILVQISQQGANVLLSWSGGSPPYQVMVTTNLSSAAWQNLGSPGSATNLLLAPTNVSSYYQVEGQ
jgi:hypothetical protein